MKLLIIFLITLCATTVVVAEDLVFELVIKNNQFQPDSLTVPAGQKVKLLVKNLDPSPEEFESYDLNREKIIIGNSQAIIYVGPLKAGEYSFFGEFNPATAQGTLIAR